MTNRRNFLKFGLVGAALTVTHEAAAIPVNAPRKFDETFDYVVVGCGAAGCVSAYHAAAQGLKVAAFEKCGVIGGSSVLCGGKWSVAGTEMQKRKGIKDDEEKYVADMLKTGKNMNDPELVRAFVRASKKEYDFYVKHAKQPDTVAIASGMSVPRGHAFDPGELVMWYYEEALKKGAKIETDADVKELLWDSSKKRVSGVRVEVEGKSKTVGTKYGVLLASGGFNRNEKLLAKYAPPMKYATTIAGVGTTGDGLLMAMSLGADTLDTNYVKASYGFKLNPTTIKDMSLIYYAGAIMVNKNGKRFVNESLSYKLLGDEALSQPEHKSWLIFDDDQRKLQMKTRAIDKGLWAPIDKGEKIPYAYYGNDLKELAKQAGLDPTVIERTVKTYNEGILSGKDEFGRTSLSSGYGKPTPIVKPPFIIYPATAALIGTYCGVRIDSTAHVLDVYGKRILGLFAAGEMIGGVHGAAYMTGTAFGKAIAFGRVAADVITTERRK